MPKTIGIIGTRRRDSFTDFNKVAEEFYKIYENGDILCSGLCPKGGDKFAVMLSQIENVPAKWFPAEWDKYGRAAGFKRNTYITRESDMLIACVAPDRTGGTEDTIKSLLNSTGQRI